MEKGLSPILSVILILITAISLTVLAVVWLPNLTLGLLNIPAFNESYIRSRGCLSIEDAKGLFGFFVLKNCGKIPLKDFKFFIDGRFVSVLNIGTMEPSQSTSFYDMPIPGGRHEIYVTADYAESPPYKLDVPFWECMGGEPTITDDWYVSKVISCICSYNTNIPLYGALYVIENGSLSLYNCNLLFGNIPYDRYVFIRGNGFLNLTRSKITVPSGMWGVVYFEDNSTIYLLNSTVNNPTPDIMDEAKLTAINSNLGGPILHSNIQHNLPISNFYGISTCGRSSDSQAAKYIKAENSNLTLNLTNTSFSDFYLQIEDNSNNTLNNVSFSNLNIYSQYPHNLTIRNWGCVGCSFFNNSFRAEGSNFALNATNLYTGWTRFFADGNSNNTIIDSCIQEIRNSYAQNSTNRFINFSSEGNWYLYGWNYTMNFINSTIRDSDETVISDGGGWVPQVIWNFTNSTIINRGFDFYDGNITIFGNVTFIGNNHFDVFYSAVNITRYFPTIIKDSYNYSFPTMQPVNITINNRNNISLWQSSVSGGNTPIQYYIEDPQILFNSSNYGSGNFFMNVSQVCENVTGVRFFNSTPLEFTIQRAFNYNGSSFNTQSARGLAFDNNNFWVAASNNNVYRYSSTGSYISNFNPSKNGLRDVASNGTYLWLLNYNSTEKRVYRYLTDGTYNSWNFLVTDVVEPYAVNFDGENFWVLGNTTIYKYNNAGSYISSFNLDRLQGEYFGDIVASNGNIWILTENYSTSKGRGVFRYKTNGVYDNWYFDIAPTTNEGRGLAYNGTYFWIMNSSGTVFRYSLTRNCLESMRQCDEFITFLPYTINKNNTRYCLLYDLYIPNKTAVTFNPTIRNSNLNCLRYKMYGNDASNTFGIYLTEVNTKNNTIMNCSIVDFETGVYIVGGSNNNTLINNVLTSNGIGFYLNIGPNNTFINNTANNNINGFVSDSTSNNNVFINNTFNSNAYGTRLYSSNTTVIGGSFALSPIADYYLSSAGSTNNFTNTNFTTTRTIYFADTTSWFNYNNETAGNIWLNTNVSTTSTITRRLINWNSTLIQWNDTATDTTVTARYNITGLVPGAPYRIYNNSIEIPGSPLKADSTGTLSFTVNLPQNQQCEIKVRAFCDYYIYSTGYTISDSNKIYCLASNIISSYSSRAIQFASGVQNSTLDCLNNLIDGRTTSNYYGIYSNQNYNVTIMNCNLTDWDTSIYYTDSNNGLIKNINITYAGSDDYAFILRSSSYKNNLFNITINTDTSGYSKGIQIESSDDNTLTNITANVGYNAIYITGSSNTLVSNSILTGGYDVPVDIWPPTWLGTKYCNHKFTNVVGKNNKPIVFYNNTNVNIRNWNNNFSEIILCNADNSVIDSVSLVNNYGIRIWNTDNSNFTNINMFNVSNPIYPLYIRSPDTGNNNRLINITAENVSAAIYMWETDYNIIKNVTSKNNDNGIYFGYNSNFNNLTDSSIFNNVIDYYFTNVDDPPGNNNVTNTNFTGTRKIYLGDTSSWFNYNNETTGNIWIRTRASGSTTLTRRLYSWSQILIRWTDNSSSTRTATYDINGLLPNMCYNVYNDSVLIYNLYSGSNGEISFTIYLQANQQRNITVNNASCNVLNLNFNEASGTVAHDSSSYGNDGTLYNGTTVCSGGDCPTWVAGKYGNALSFDGINDYVYLGNKGVFNVQNITITAWIKTSKDGVNPILSKQNYGNNGYWFGTANSGQPYFYLWSGGTLRNQLGGVDITDGLWHFVAVTYDGYKVNYYLDSSNINYTYDYGSYLPIGSSSEYLRVSELGNSVLDELRVWSRALTSSEIQTEMNKG